MAGPRSYDRNTLSSLGYLSGGLCYYPGCPDPVFRERDGYWHLIGQIAHIRAANCNGPRYDSSMTDDERRAIENLMIFCHPHHSLIDKLDNAPRYPVAVLHRWKAQHEADPNEAVKRLREVSPSGLRKIVADGLQQHDALMLRAIARLETSDQEAASVMRSLIEELTEAYAIQRQSLNPEMVELLNLAADKLTHFGGFERIELLNLAADKLAHHSYVPEALDSAVSRLEQAARRLPEY
ncbi:hypothetical protein [Actinomadura napierensis]|uniref:HNH endonuclease n=1 Tax=Actinomadura napierensis TaxID=267854 RepID=A0ABN3A9A1_9ACTN